MYVPALAINYGILWRRALNINTQRILASIVIFCVSVTEANLIGDVVRECSRPVFSCDSEMINEQWNCSIHLKNNNIEVSSASRSKCEFWYSDPFFYATIYFFVSISLLHYRISYYLSSDKWHGYCFKWLVIACNLDWKFGEYSVQNWTQSTLYAWKSSITFFPLSVKGERVRDNRFRSWTKMSCGLMTFKIEKLFIPCYLCTWTRFRSSGSLARETTSFHNPWL